MAKILGTPITVGMGSTNPVELPTNSEPTPILRQSEAPIFPYSSSSGDDPTYMVKGDVADGSPGFLDAKIGTNFSIVASKITLANLTGFTTTDLTEGTNLYYTQARFDTAFGLKTTTNLTEGTNLYYTEARVSANTDVAANTAATHTHSNKSTLDLITEAFTTTLKATYDGYSTKVVNGVTGPITFTAQTIAHADTVGYKHIPDDTGVAQGYILSKGSSDGVYTWIENNGGTGITLDATPTTSTTAAVQSAWVKNHNDNSLTDKNHITDADVTYLGTTIPTHIANASIHLPSFVVGDADKYLQINATGNGLEWDTVDSSISITGETYISISGTVITADAIDITDTNITQGSNIVIVGNTISATQRGIDQTPVSGETTESISSDWAYDHSTLYGNLGHIPAASSTNYFLAWDGTFKDISEYAGSVDVLDYVLAMQEDATLDPGISPTTGDRYIVLDITALNSNFGVITGVGDNDIVTYDGANFIVAFDASATAASVEVTATLDINLNVDRQWYYSYTGSEWRDRGLTSSIYWTKSGTNLSPATVGDDILLPVGDKLAWDTGVSYITASATNVLGVYINSTEVLQANATNIVSNIPISVDNIIEKTAAAGITLDGVLLKDLGVTATILNVESSTTRIQKDGSNNMTFTDAITGTKTLAELATGGSVTSVAMTVPTGLAISGSPITTTGTLALAMDTGYTISTTAKQTEWDTAYTNNLRWDGGATSLVAATGRTSLGLVLGVNVQSYTQIPQALTQSTSILTMDIASGYNARVTLTASITTFTWSTAATAGDSGILTVIQDGTGGWTLALPTGHLAEGGSLTLSTAASSKDVLGWYYDGVNYFWNLGEAFA